MAKKSENKVASAKNDGNNAVVLVLKEVASRLRFGSFKVKCNVHNGRITKIETFDERAKHNLI